MTQSPLEVPPDPPPKTSQWALYVNMSFCDIQTTGGREIDDRQVGK
jgi:hypothetical protein